MLEIDDVVAQRLLERSPAARAAIGVDEAIDATGMLRLLRPPSSIYTALAASGHGRLLATVDENPAIGNAILKLVRGLFNFAWRQGVALSAVDARGGGYDRLADAFSIELFVVPESADARDNDNRKLDDDWDAICAHHARLARIASAPGVAAACEAMVEALRRFAERHRVPLSSVGLRDATYTKTIAGACRWRGYFDVLA